tara:strand:- start:52 stop:501 length:450 start_codon:yes stop_codon:yes gene_type:complete
LAASHLNEHTTRINKRVIVPVSRLQKGMVVESRYKPQDSEAKRYMLLILQPKYNNFVHALNLDVFSYRAFDELALEQGLRYIPSFAKYRGINMPKLILETSSRRFYFSNLKSKLKNDFNRAYRTMNYNKFSTISLVDYKFSIDTQKLAR